MNLNTIFTIVFGLLSVVGYIGYKISQNRNKKDPDYEQKIRERAAEYERRLKEDKYIDNSIEELNYDYDEE